MSADASTSRDKEIDYSIRNNDRVRSMASAIIACKEGAYRAARSRRSSIKL